MNIFQDKQQIDLYFDAWIQLELDPFPLIINSYYNKLVSFLSLDVSKSLSTSSLVFLCHSSVPLTQC